MARTSPARNRRPLTRGVPTKPSHRPRLLTAAAAILLAAALATYPATLGSQASTVSGVIAGAGVVLVLAALAGLWEDGLVAGPALFLIAYATALAVAHHPLDPAAPIFATGLLALVDLGSWSLELRDSREVTPLHHLRTLLTLTLGGLATSAAVLAVGHLGTGGGIALWLLGAAAAAALFTLIRPRAKASARIASPRVDSRKRRLRYTRHQFDEG